MAGTHPVCEVFGSWISACTEILMGRSDRHHNKIDEVFITVAECVFQVNFTSAALIVPKSANDRLECAEIGIGTARWVE